MKALSSIPPSILPLRQQHAPHYKTEIASESKKAVNLFATVLKRPQKSVPLPLSDDDYNYIDGHPHSCQSGESSEDELSVESSSETSAIMQDDLNVSPIATGASTVKVIQLKSTQNVTPCTTEESENKQLASDYSKCLVPQLRSLCSQRGLHIARNAKKIEMLQALREHDKSLT